MDRKVVFLMIAKPPCFSSQEKWVIYLEGRDDEARAGHNTGPLTQDRMRFNMRFNFCADCTQQHSFKMENEGRCKPAHLQTIDEPSTV